MGIPNFLGEKRDGLFRRNVVRVNSTADRSAAVLGELTYEESGTIFLVPGGATGQLFQLPKISSKWLGIEYTFHVSTQSSSTVIKINCALDSSAYIKTNYSSVVDEHSSIIPGTTQATAITLTAVSSVVWMGQPLTHNSYSGSSDPTSNCGGWTTG